MTTAYPLAWPDGWPRTPSGRRGKAPFGTTWDNTRRDVYRELAFIGSKTCVISSNLDLRLDGQPRGDQALARLSDPGVALYFSLRDRPMTMAQDKYLTVIDNLRSLTLAVRYLRGLERHGGGHMMERAFGGFAQLPPPDGGRPAEKPWREVFAPLPDGLDKADLLAIVERRFRDKAKAAHPDQGGSDEEMIVLNAALARAREELG